MKIFLAGHKGLVGSAILRKLKKKNYKNIIIADRKKLDLLSQSSVYKFLKKNKPDIVIIAAAKVGGVLNNSRYGADFIYENLQIQNNLINGSYINKIRKLIFLGSSCIYPKNSKQPIKEEYLLNGKLEETNEPYAISKIAGVKMCEAFNKQYNTNYLCLMPTNTYGPNDNYDLLDSHFFPALIRKAYECKLKGKKSIEVWGSGKPLRELIFVDDIADACIYFMTKKIKYSLVNIGVGKDMTIKKYVNFLLKKLNLKVKIKFNTSRPDGVYRKVLNVNRAKKLGWKAKINLDKGFDITYRDFLKKY
ncbi:MAG: GDP-L-fucose synthase family protein [Candidatus Pelagibacter sp.]|tara:strand:- start:27 stop:941 length:915 start_codon:yes stop_codon:yes gene_type:complete